MPYILWWFLLGDRILLIVAIGILLQQLYVEVVVVPDYQLKTGILFYKDIMYLGTSSSLRLKQLDSYHNSIVGGHLGIHVTYLKLKKYFFWPGMLKDVRNRVKTYDVCARCKGEHCAYPDLLQPLPIPSQAWQEISMDFIEGLPKSKEKNVIAIIIYKLTKLAHFLPLSHPFSAATVAHLFMDHIYKLHGMPMGFFQIKIISLLAYFGKDYSNPWGKISLWHSLLSQSNGQTKRVKQCLENYLRCMVYLKPTSWV